MVTLTNFRMYGSLSQIYRNVYKCGGGKVKISGMKFLTVLKAL